MSTFRWFPAMFFALGALAAAPGAQAQKCQADVPWQHQHTEAKPDTATTDIKGTRATTLVVCLSDKPVPAGTKVEIQFEGSHGARPLAAGQCTEKLAKWAVIRTFGPRTDAGPGEVSGLYRICKG